MDVPLDLRACMLILAAAAASITSLGCGNDGGCGTPLVLSFDGSAVEYVTTPATTYFELGQHDGGRSTDWPTSKTPWLARDLNGDGQINGGRELFGSETVLGDGRLAQNGFEALAELDTDGDGRVGETDAAWESVLVWHDDDNDRFAGPGELETARAAGLLWIDLPGTHLSGGIKTGIQAPDQQAPPRCDARGNCEVERSDFGYVDSRRVRRGVVIDIHLRTFAIGTGTGAANNAGPTSGYPPGDYFPSCD